MEIQNDTVTALSYGDKPCRQVRPHVFEVPPELGEHLLSFTHQGWRHPDPVEPAFVPVPVPIPAPVPPDPDLVPDVLDAAMAPDDDAGPDVPDVPPQPPQEPPVAAASPSGTVAEALVAMADAAGPRGVTSAEAVAAHGRQAYNVLGPLVEDGRLVRAGRGRYVHPDHA